MEMLLTSLPPERLLGVIATQTEVAKLGLDLGAVMDLAVIRAQKLTGASGAVIELREDECMVYRAATGIAAPQLGLRLRVDTSLSGWCVREASAAICVDTESDQRVDRGACRRVGIRSMLVVPLMFGGNAVGVLKVLSSSPSAVGADDLELLNLLSELVAASMYHAMARGADDLLHRATHDALTGLGNRALFYDALRQAIARAAREHVRFALLYLDMDGLKAANDRLGHAAGDQLLRTLGDRLLATALQPDLVARVGGDEFCVILAHVDDAAEAQAAAQRYATAIDGDIQIAGERLAVCASVGVAVFPDDGEDTETLVAAADLAMYRDKQGRKGRC